MVRSFAGLVALVASLGLTLCGCTTARPIPAGLSEEELAEQVRLELDDAWQATGLDGIVARPHAEFERYIGDEEWAAVIAGCMNDQGFHQYRANGGALFVGAIPRELAQKDMLARFVCDSRFPYDSRRHAMLSADQLEYVYDYYAGWLIPCLELHGHDVVGVPDRTTFRAIAAYDVWNPAFAVTGSMAGPEARAVVEACEPWPNGIFEER